MMIFVNSESAIGKTVIHFPVKIKNLFWKRRKTESIKKDKGKFILDVCRGDWVIDLLQKSGSLIQNLVGL